MYSNRDRQTERGREREGKRREREGESEKDVCVTTMQTHEDVCTATQSITYIMIKKATRTGKHLCATFPCHHLPQTISSPMCVYRLCGLLVGRPPRERQTRRFPPSPPPPTPSPHPSILPVINTPVFMHITTTILSLISLDTKSTTPAKTLRGGC